MLDPVDLERGWSVLPQLLSVGECADILHSCAALCSADPATLHHRDKPVAGTQHLEALDVRLALVAEVIGRSLLLDAVQAWFDGAAPAQPLSQVSFRSPGPGFGQQDLHRDAIEGSPVAVTSVVTAIVPLVDFTAENGATRVVPGSHATSEAAARYTGRRRHHREQLLVGPAGTAFVFSGHLLHAGGQNNSAKSRPALQLVWREPHPTPRVAAAPATR